MFRRSCSPADGFGAFGIRQVRTGIEIRNTSTNPVLKATSIRASRISIQRVCLKDHWNCGRERLHSGTRVVGCPSKAELEKGDSFDANCELVVCNKRLAMLDSGGGLIFKSIFFFDKNFKSIYGASLMNVFKMTLQ
ncbi:hypothetical protein QQ045_014825 [Rhodiola kirilowii]